MSEYSPRAQDSAVRINFHETKPKISEIHTSFESQPALSVLIDGAKSEMDKVACTSFIELKSLKSDNKEDDAENQHRDTTRGWSVGCGWTPRDLS